MKHALIFGIVLIATGAAVAAEPESPDRVDPVLDCSTPVLDADTPEQAKLLRVQFGGDALVRALRETYASRLAGLFWDQLAGKESRLVLRLTGEEPVENNSMMVCSEPLTVVFVPGAMHAREELAKLHSSNLEWLRSTFPGLQGTYADERTGEIVLEVFEPEGGSDVEAFRKEAESRLGASLRVEMTTAKVVPQ